MALFLLGGQAVASEQVNTVVKQYIEAGFDEDVPVAMLIDRRGDVVFFEEGSGAAKRIGQQLQSIDQAMPLAESETLRERLLRLPQLHGTSLAERLLARAFDAPVLVSVVVDKAVFDCAGCTLYLAHFDEHPPRAEHWMINLVSE